MSAVNFPLLRIAHIRQQQQQRLATKTSTLASLSLAQPRREMSNNHGNAKLPSPTPSSMPELALSFPWHVSSHTTCDHGSFKPFLAPSTSLRHLQETRKLPLVNVVSEDKRIYQKRLVSMQRLGRKLIHDERRLGTPFHTFWQSLSLQRSAHQRPFSQLSESSLTLLDSNRFTSFRAH